MSPSSRRFLAAAMMLGAMGGAAAPSDRVPAKLRFSGRTWSVVHDPNPRGPGPNLFDGRNVHVDKDGRLVLETARREGAWTSAHVFLTKSLGYGTYELHIAPMDKPLDRLAVFGFFTWDEDSAFANREIDIELARWGVAQAPNLNFTVQPWEGHPERNRGFEFDLRERTVLRFEWTPETIRFSAISGSREAAWAFPDLAGSGMQPFGVPPKGQERVGINLWLFQGSQPSEPDRIVIERFVFTPWAGR